MSMDIYTKPGKKVIVTNETAKNGSDADKEAVRLLLKIGKPYTVEAINVHNFSTDVYIKGFTQSFNSVNFDNL